jgi:phosphoribosylamine--glycine ligase
MTTKPKPPHANATAKPVSELPLLKRGSVKNLYTLSDTELVFEFSDDFSVFDWGKMPDTVPEKGRSLLLLASYLFRELSHPASWQGFFRSSLAAETLGSDFEKLPARLAAIAPALRRELESVGLRSCFRGTYPKGGDPQGLIVEAFRGIPPKRVESGDVIGFDYSGHPTNAPGTLIPLEVVFRHALTDKSSFFERNPETKLKPGHRFEVPLVEFFTKLEPTDRFIVSRDEACMVGRITPEKLPEMELRTVFLSLWLRRECELRSLELIDGKFEWGFDSEGRISLADAIGPDELRLVEGTDRLSKEFLREYYRDSKWFAEIQELKKAGRQGPGWQKLVREPAPMLPKEGLARATSLYRKLEARFRPETVLLFGAGGREHEIARRLLDSPNLRTLIWAPGQDAGFENLRRTVSKTANASRKQIVRWEDGAWATNRAESLIQRAHEAGVTLVILSQDNDLASGAADAFRSAGFSVFGPSRDAARIEWSKAFSKEICKGADVRTAKAHVAKSRDEAERILRDVEWSAAKKWVVKADGLALGKGVVVAETREEALASLEALGKYGNEFIIEERLAGEECSWFAFADGETFSLLDPAKDYKRLRDGQTGPNTGGMGAVSPAPGTTPEMRERIRREVFTPIFGELRKRGIPYQGLLYAGLMVDETGGGTGAPAIAVLEFNARFGDPETQALLPRLLPGAKGDLLLWMAACARGTLSDYPRDVPFTERTAVYVVAAAEGYPDAPKTGAPIRLDDEILAEETFRFAGVKRTGSAGWVVSGGRVLGATGMGATVDSARSEAYRSLERVLFPGAQIRKDIGK